MHIIASSRLAFLSLLISHPSSPSLSLATHILSKNKPAINDLKKWIANNFLLFKNVLTILQHVIFQWESYERTENGIVKYIRDWSTNSIHTKHFINNRVIQVLSFFLDYDPVTWELRKFDYVAANLLNLNAVSYGAFLHFVQINTFTRNLFYLRDTSLRLSE